MSRLAEQFTMCQRQPALHRALFAALVCLSTTALAQAQIGAVGKCGDGCGCPCVPKTETWGVYQTQWHRWPGTEQISPLRRGPEIIGLPPTDLPPKETETDRPGGSQPSLGGPKTDILDRPRLSPQTGPDRTMDKSPEKTPDRTPVIPKGPGKAADEDPFGSVNRQPQRGGANANPASSTYGTAIAPFTPSRNLESPDGTSAVSRPSAKIARPNPLRDDRTAGESSRIPPASAANPTYEGAKIGTIIPDATNMSAASTARSVGFNEPAPLQTLPTSASSPSAGSNSLPKPQAPPAAPRQLTPIKADYYEDNQSVSRVQRAFNSNAAGTRPSGEQAQYNATSQTLPNLAGPTTKLAPAATPFTAPPVPATKTGVTEPFSATIAPAPIATNPLADANALTTTASRPAVKPRANPLRDAEAAAPADAQPANVEESPVSPKMQPRPNPLRAVESERKSDVMAATWVDDAKPARAAIRPRANPLREGSSVMASDSAVAPAIWIDDSASSASGGQKKLPKFQQ